MSLMYTIIVETCHFEGINIIRVDNELEMLDYLKEMKKKYAKTDTFKVTALDDNKKGRIFNHSVERPPGYSIGSW